MPIRAAFLPITSKMRAERKNKRKATHGKIQIMRTEKNKEPEMPRCSLIHSLTEVSMRKASWVMCVAALSAAGVSFAQSGYPEPTTEIRESTDPATVAEAERRAAEVMQAQQEREASSGSSDSSATRSGPAKRMKKQPHRSHPDASDSSSPAQSQ